MDSYFVPIPDVSFLVLDIAFHILDITVLIPDITVLIADISFLRKMMLGTWTVKTVHISNIDVQCPAIFQTLKNVWNMDSGNCPYFGY